MSTPELPELPELLTQEETNTLLLALITSAGEGGISEDDAQALYNECYATLFMAEAIRAAAHGLPITIRRDDAGELTVGAIR